MDIKKLIIAILLTSVGTICVFGGIYLLNFLPYIHQAYVIGGLGYIGGILWVYSLLTTKKRR